MVLSAVNEVMFSSRSKGHGFQNLLREVRLAGVSVLVWLRNLPIQPQVAERANRHNISDHYSEDSPGDITSFIINVDNLYYT